MKANLHPFIRALRHGCAFFVFAFCATTALANEKTLSGETRDSQVFSSASTVTLNGLTLTALKSADYAGLYFNDTSTIIIADDTENIIDCSRSSRPAIFIKSGCTLTIKGGEKGNGKLICTGGSNSAAIGASPGNAAGNIIIEGGIIEASATSNGAAIGGGYGQRQSTVANCGNITIKGGSVTAIGPSETSGCGIGGGSGRAQCNAITITGGTVVATGGNNSDGIGGSGANAKCSFVKISGGTVTVTGGAGAAAIGGYASIVVTITGEDVCVTATKGSGAADIIGFSDGASVASNVSVDPSLVSTYSDDGKTVVISAAAEEAELEITGVSVSVANSTPTVHLTCELEASDALLAAFKASDIKVKTATSLSELDDAEFSKDCIENAAVSADGTFSFDVVRELPSGASTLFIRVAIEE